MSYIGFIVAFAVFIYAASIFTASDTNSALAWLMASIMLICVFVMANIIR